MPGSTLSSNARRDAGSSSLAPAEEGNREPSGDIDRLSQNIEDGNDEETAGVHHETRLVDQAAAQSLNESNIQTTKQTKETQFSHYVPGSGRRGARFTNGHSPLVEGLKLDPFRYSNAVNPFEDSDHRLHMDAFELDWTPSCVFDRNRLQMYRYRCLSSDGAKSIKYLTIGSWYDRDLKAPVPDYFWKNRKVVQLLFKVSSG